MIVKGAYFGKIPIYRLYRGRNLVWWVPYPVYTASVIIAMLHSTGVVDIRPEIPTEHAGIDHTHFTVRSFPVEEDIDPISAQYLFDNDFVAPRVIKLIKTVASTIIDTSLSNVAPRQDCVNWVLAVSIGCIENANPRTDNVLWGCANDIFPFLDNGSARAFGFVWANATDILVDRDKMSGKPLEYRYTSGRNLDGVVANCTPGVFTYVYTSGRSLGGTTENVSGRSYKVVFAGGSSCDGITENNSARQEEPAKITAIDCSYDNGETRALEQSLVKIEATDCLCDNGETNISQQTPTEITATSLLINIDRVEPSVETKWIQSIESYIIDSDEVSAKPEIHGKHLAEMRTGTLITASVEINTFRECSGYLILIDQDRVSADVQKANAILRYEGCDILAQAGAELVSVEEYGYQFTLILNDDGSEYPGSVLFGDAEYPVENVSAPEESGEDEIYYLEIL